MKSMFGLGVAFTRAVVLSACGGGKQLAVSSEGVIADSKTGLEWVVGPDGDTYYAQAEQWVSACKAAGVGWRMPTRAELKTLYQQGVGERNMDPAFETTGWWVWAEPRDSSSAWYFTFNHRGSEGWSHRDESNMARVFAVRSRPRIVGFADG